MIPQELKEFQNFVAWRYEERDGKKTKVPYNATTRKRAKSNDPATWNTWQEVENCPPWADGIGFMFSNSPFVGVDVDHCLDGGEQEEIARGMAKELGTYCEVSPSGEGLHMIGRGDLEKGFRRGCVEVYPHGRYFTLTGNVWQGLAEIVDIQAGLDKLAKELQKKEPPPVISTTETAATSRGETAAPGSVVPPVGISTAELAARIRKSRQGEMFAALYDRGDVSAYGGDDSAGDVALMNILPFWCGGDTALMEAVFSESALGQREKWRKRKDYREQTIAAALETWNGEVYDPEEYKQKQVQIKLDRSKLPEETLEKLTKLPQTDTGNAERLKLAKGDTIRYLPEKGKGAAWYMWNGKLWKPSFEISLYGVVTEVMDLTHKAASKYITLENYGREYMSMFERMASWLHKSCNQNRIDSCLKRARGVFEGHLSDFDKDGYLLNVQNGIVDLKTGELLPHDKKYMCSKICRAEYNPTLRGVPSLWTKTLESIIPDEQERHYLQKWAGYMLTGSATEEKLLFLYGIGGSGKGTFLNTLGYMMGDYGDTIDIEIFLSSRNDGHAGGAAASPEIAKLAGLRTAIASESGAGRKMNDAKLKNLTGRDDITARFLYGQQFTFKPSVKFVLMSNYLPAIHDVTDSGIGRRLVIAPFMEDLSSLRDISLKERLQEPENLAAVLAWCVDGCLMWQQEKLGEPPRRYKNQVRQFYADSDTLQQFLDDECKTGPGVRAKVKDVFAKYQEWTGEKIKRKTFMFFMERKGYNSHRYNNGIFFDGLELKADCKPVYGVGRSHYPF